MKQISKLQKLRCGRYAFVRKNPYASYFLDIVIYGVLLFFVLSTTSGNAVEPWSLDALLSSFLLGSIISGARIIDFFHSKDKNDNN